MKGNSKYVFGAGVILGMFASLGEGAVVISSDVGQTAMTQSELQSVLVGKQRFWGGGQAVQVAYLSDEAVLKELESFSGMNQGRFKNHWNRLVFTGKGVQPKEFDDLDSLRAFVNSGNGVIALVPEGADGFAAQLEVEG